MTRKLPNPPPFCPEKNRRHKLNWLIAAQLKELAVNWLRGTKQTQGYVWLGWAAKALRFHSTVPQMKMCFLLLQNVMLYSGHIVLWTKANGTLKTRSTVPNPSGIHYKGHSLLAFRQLLSRDPDARKWKETKFLYQVLSQRYRPAAGWGGRP